MIRQDFVRAFERGARRHHMPNIGLKTDTCEVIFDMEDRILANLFLSLNACTRSRPTTNSTFRVFSGLTSHSVTTSQLSISARGRVFNGAARQGIVEGHVGNKSSANYLVLKDTPVARRAAPYTHHTTAAPSRTHTHTHTRTHTTNRFSCDTLALSLEESLQGASQHKILPTLENSPGREVSFWRGFHKNDEEVLTLIIREKLHTECATTIFANTETLVFATAPTKLSCIKADTASLYVFSVTLCEAGTLSLYLHTTWCHSRWSGPLPLPETQRTAKLFEINLTCSAVMKRPRSCVRNPWGENVVGLRGHRNGHLRWPFAMRNSEKPILNALPGVWRLLRDGQFQLDATQLMNMSRHGETQIQWLSDHKHKHFLSVVPMRAQYQIDEGAFFIQMHWSNGNSTLSGGMPKGAEGIITDASEGAFVWHSYTCYRQKLTSPQLSPREGLTPFSKLPNRVAFLGSSRTRILAQTLSAIVTGSCETCVKTLDDLRLGDEHVQIDFIPFILTQLEETSASRWMDHVQLAQKALQNFDAWTDILVMNTISSLRTAGYCTHGGVLFVSIGSHEIAWALGIELSTLAFQKFLSASKESCLAFSMGTLRVIFVTELPWYDAPKHLETPFGHFGIDRTHTMNEELKKVAEDHHLVVVDLFNLFLARPDGFVDGAHPYSRWKGMWNDAPSIRVGNALCVIAVDALVASLSVSG